MCCPRAPAVHFVYTFPLGSPAPTIGVLSATLRFPLVEGVVSGLLRLSDRKHRTPEVIPSVIYDTAYPAYLESSTKYHGKPSSSAYCLRPFHHDSLPGEAVCFETAVAFAVLWKRHWIERYWRMGVVSTVVPRVGNPNFIRGGSEYYHAYAVLWLDLSDEERDLERTNEFHEARVAERGNDRASVNKGCRQIGKRKFDDLQNVVKSVPVDGSSLAREKPFPPAVVVAGLAGRSRKERRGASEKKRPVRSTLSTRLSTLLFNYALRAAAHEETDVGWSWLVSRIDGKLIVAEPDLTLYLRWSAKEAQGK
ncbi:hypothetical protein EDD15DRAFT_2203897 [Pisolithus albus]|nr:hypothetical protein EDD15DRAFT_2203897 [Pisolithus albus]